MKKSLIVGLVILSLFLASPVRAQTVDNSALIKQLLLLVQQLQAQLVLLLQQQTNNGGQTTATCLARDLTVGSTGDDVVILQDLLIKRGFLTLPSGVAKGYFGPSTEKAVIQLQRSLGIDVANGYVSSFTYQKINAFLGCPTSSLGSNRQLAINSFSGPSTLKVMEVVVWKVKTTNAGNKPTYSIAWGDGVTTYEPQQVNNSSQVATFSHIYGQAGDYVVTLSVKSEDGQTAQLSKVIKVASKDESTNNDDNEERGRDDDHEDNAQTETASPKISAVSVDKTNYSVGDTYTVTWRLDNAPTTGSPHIGISLFNESGSRVFNLVNTCDYVADCVNINAQNGTGSYHGTIPAAVGTISPTVSNGKYRFEVSLVANKAFVTNSLSSEAVNIPLAN